MFQPSIPHRDQQSKNVQVVFTSKKQKDVHRFSQDAVEIEPGRIRNLSLREHVFRVQIPLINYDSELCGTTLTTELRYGTVRYAMTNCISLRSQCNSFGCHYFPERRKKKLRTNAG